MRRFCFLLVFIAAACQPAPQPTLELPTLALIPSLTPSDEPTLTATQTETPRPTDTPAPTLTATAFPTRTPRPTQTQRPIDPTLAGIATSTASAQEAPRFYTLTPSANGETNQVIADVVITESQFQEELNKQIANKPSIQKARADFVPGGILVELTALGGQAFITGRVMVNIQLTGSFATISIGDIQVNAPEPPEAYVQVINEDFFPAMLATLDSILTQRLGDNHDLQNLVMTDTTMELYLLVPES
jgi:hypothetical protein